jgi:hypothetical protein
MILSHLIIIRRVPLEEDVGSPPVFLLGSCCSIFSILCSIYIPLFGILSFFLFAILQLLAIHLVSSNFTLTLLLILLHKKTTFLYYHKKSSNIANWDKMQWSKDKRWSTTQYIEVTNVTKTGGKHMCSGRESSGTRSVTV